MSDTTTSNSYDVVDQGQLAPLRLAFVGGPRDGQAISITAENCTIGSSDQATLRLVCKGVHPTHCMITRGQHRDTIKRLADDTYLNDGDFEECELHANDVLTIGPLRFRVVATEQNNVSPALQSDSTDDKEAKQLRQRCDELMSQLEALQQERSPDDSQVASAQPTTDGDEQAKLEQRLAELEAERERDRQALEAKQAEIEAARVEAERAREALAAAQQQQQDEAAYEVASALGVEAQPNPEPYQQDPEEAQNYPQASRTMAMEMLNRLREDSPAVPEQQAASTSQESSYEQSTYEQSSLRAKQLRAKHLRADRKSV